MNKQQYLDEVLFEQDNEEFSGLCVNDLSEVPARYKGLVLYVNDHGNVTLYKAFKNGNVHEIASRV